MLPDRFPSVSPRFFHIVALWPMLFALMACKTITSKAAPRSALLEEPQPVATDGPFLHEGSGLTYPMTIGDLNRSGIIQYDESGYDVSGGYAPSSPAIQYTVYIYPGPEMDYIMADPELVESLDQKYLLRELERVSEQITSRHDAIELETEGVLTTPIGRGHYRSWTFDRPTLLGPVKLYTTVRLVLWDHHWYVKVRATGPEARAAQIDKESDAIIEALVDGSP